MSNINSIKKSIDVVYVNYFSAEDTIASIESFYALKINDYFDITILIVDNSFTESNQEDVLKLRNLGKKFKNKDFKVNYLPSDNNIGFGKACNKIISYGKARTILFLNCDTDFKNTKVKDLVRTIKDIKKNIGIIGPKVISPENLLHASCFSFDPTSIFLKPFRHVRKIGKLSSFIPEYKFFKKRIDRIIYEGMDKTKKINVDWVSGCCMFVSRDFFISAGGFDDIYFLYFEDVDLCRKAKQLNYQVIFDPRVTVIHKGRHESSSVSGLLRSILKNNASRIHISSWLKYIIKWRKDFFLKLFYLISKSLIIKLLPTFLRNYINRKSNNYRKFFIRY